MASTYYTALKGIAFSIGAFLLFGIVTGLIPNPFYVRMVPRTPADYLFLTTTSLFVGAFIIQREMADEPIGGRTATGGVIGGFLAFGCPICNAVLLTLFSSSALMTYFDPLRPVLGVVSIPLFAALLYHQHQRNCPTC
ncbi:hypothetical protein [Haladaptatus paucihalophilus]|uniref:Uncharacterized protein n=1 Tax=Haladaptatus paucihalophilus DX253 TaxID=797209 RepID=A0A1M7C451_HALPU|nr:hypothetical protein SAMN05444342_4274 [Haladaptatus paucihalophilus DX253]